MMEAKMFDLVLQTISAGLVGKIMSSTGENEDTVMEALYSSELYAVLEKEETKVWHYSVTMLHELFVEERTTGKLTLPDH